MNQLTREPLTRQDAHVGNVRHGVATGPWRVEYVAAVDTTDLAAARKIVQGSVVSLNATGKYVVGCAAGSGINNPVPFISLKNVFDPDVTTGKSGISVTYGGGTYSTDLGTATLSAMGGNITAIPTTCGYELETTEFDAAATYAFNDGVIPATGDAIGKITVATAGPGGADPYLGFVSIPPTKDYFGNDRVAFFANFIPSGVGTAAMASLDDGTYTKIIVSGGTVSFE